MRKLNISLLDDTKISENELFELYKSKRRAIRQKKEDIEIQNHIFWTEKPNDANFWILPNSINEYHKTKKFKRIFNTALQNALKFNKKTLLFSSGDYGISLPNAKHYIVYRCSGYTSKLKANEKILPFFLTDPLSNISITKKLSPSKVGSFNVPRIGFCGKAPNATLHHTKELLQVILHNLKAFLCFTKLDSQSVVSSSWLRSQILTAILKNDRLKSDFIIREKYRAGAVTEYERQISTIEYYQNILNNQFIVCIRGKGNFSVRFYETLAMGRIPLFCDTDSPLPEINDSWDKYIIRFSPNDIKKLPDIIHQWMDGKDLQQVFKQNRKLWEEQLSLKGFWINELKRLHDDI